eukprot:GFYU01017901.1.p1 GENE.GFYU01017901.1~~GFYU01017901.1.p1  ORF type:complete len:233 (+),score=48.72 GFYU01017901.1:147-845(+)
MGNLCSTGLCSTGIGRRAMRIVLEGEPGSDTKAVAEMLQERYGVAIVDLGEMIAKHVKDEDDVGVKIEKYVRAGELIPVDLIADLVFTRLSDQECSEYGWVLIGFPRSEEQIDRLHSKGWFPDAVFYLEMPSNVMKEYLSGIQVDAETGKLYNVNTDKNIPSAVQRRLLQRAQETPAAIERRILMYKETMKVLSRNYETLLSRVDGLRTNEQLTEDVTSILDSTRLFSQSLW